MVYICLYVQYNYIINLNINFQLISVIVEALLCLTNCQVPVIVKAYVVETSPLFTCIVSGIVCSHILIWRQKVFKAPVDKGAVYRVACNGDVLYTIEDSVRPCKIRHWVIISRMCKEMGHHLATVELMKPSLKCINDALVHGLDEWCCVWWQPFDLESKNGISFELKSSICTYCCCKVDCN